MSKQRYNSNDELKAAVTSAFGITSAMLRKMCQNMASHNIMQRE